MSKKIVEYLPFVGIVVATCVAAVAAGREPGTGGHRRRGRGPGRGLGMALGRG